MLFAGFCSVFRSLRRMAMSHMGVVCGGLVVAGFVTFGGLLVMRGCLLVLLSRLFVMLLHSLLIGLVFRRCLCHFTAPE